MGAEAFGRLVRAAMDEQGLKQARLGRRVSKRLRGDRGLDSTQVRLVLEGRRRLDHELVEAFIAELSLDSATAWHAAGLWPPDLDPDGYRVFVQAGGTNSSKRIPAGRHLRAA
jgi:hypothetical protein